MQEDIADFMHSGDCYCLPCVWAEDNDVDGLPQMLMEAMACGLPVVGTTSATQGVEGQADRDYLVADDATAFIDHICRLLSEPQLGRDLGIAARAFVEENYNWEAALEPLDEIVARCSRARGESPAQ